MLTATSFGLLLVCSLWQAESLLFSIHTCRQSHCGVHHAFTSRSVAANLGDVRVRRPSLQTALRATRDDGQRSGEKLVGPHSTTDFDAAPRLGHSFGSATFSAAAATIGGLSTFAARALAETGPAEVEVADLPPVYLPVAFAVLLLGGVGLLTGSLGDVMSDEASLGNLSGAKAKKEMERSRSSYFKK